MGKRQSFDVLCGRARCVCVGGGFSVVKWRGGNRKRAEMKMNELNWQKKRQLG